MGTSRTTALGFGVARRQAQAWKGTFSRSPIGAKKWSDYRELFLDLILVHLKLVGGRELLSDFSLVPLDIDCAGGALRHKHFCEVIFLTVRELFSVLRKPDQRHLNETFRRGRVLSIIGRAEE